MLKETAFRLEFSLSGIQMSSDIYIKIYEPILKTKNNKYQTKKIKAKNKCTYTRCLFSGSLV